MDETETQTCRSCGTEVKITRDENGMVEQTDGAGLVVCDACWEDEAARERRQWEALSELAPPDGYTVADFSWMIGSD